MYNNDDEIMIFTVHNWDRRTVDKCDMNPHYVLCPVDKLNLVLYSCDDDGGGSTLIQHWVAFPKILKEMNKKKAFMEAKKQKDKKKLKGK